MYQSGMTIVIDTREQKPWKFSPEVKTVTKKIDPGDYSILGLERIVRVERKGCDEIWSMVGSDADRFRSQLLRLSTYPVRALFIEGTVENIIHRPTFSTVSYTNFMYRLMRWTTAAGVPVWFLGNRCPATMTMIEEFFKAVRHSVMFKKDYTTKFGWRCSDEDR